MLLRVDQLHFCLSTLFAAGATFDASGMVPNQHAKQVVQDWVRNNPDPDPRRDLGAGHLSEVAVGGCGTPVERCSFPGNTKAGVDLQVVAGAAAAAAAAASCRQYSSELSAEGVALLQAAGTEEDEAAAPGGSTEQQEAAGDAPAPSTVAAPVPAQAADAQ